MQQISDALKIPVEAIQNFDDEQAINIISNTFHDSAIANTFSENAQANYHCTFNPVDKWLEALEEIKRLNEELLKVKDEQIKLLQSVVEKM